MMTKKSSLKKSERFISAHRLAWFLLIALFSALAVLALLHHHNVQPSHPIVGAQSYEFLSPVPKTSRGAVYPYSVIPGGVRDVAELKDAIARDPVVSAHYSEFQLANLRVVRLDRARLLHVSYRIGDRIYWTKRRMSLPKGETIITDGVRMARTRCGNLAADVIPAASQLSTLVTEPTPEALDTPANSVGVAISTENVPLELLLTPPADSPALAVEGGPSSAGTTSIPTPGGSTGPGGTSPGTLPSSPIPVVPVPEPGTLLQLSAGLAALALLRKFVSSASTINRF
jgi:hypothetical protein